MSVENVTEGRRGTEAQSALKKSLTRKYSQSLRHWLNFFELKCKNKEETISELSNFPKNIPQKYFQAISAANTG